MSRVAMSASLLSPIGPADHAGRRQASEFYARFECADRGLPMHDVDAIHWPMRIPAEGAS